MSWRAVRESEKMVAVVGGGWLHKYRRPSLMANSSAVRIEAVAGKRQAVAVEREGRKMAAPTEGGEERREPSV